MGRMPPLSLLGSLLVAGLALESWLWSRRPAAPMTPERMRRGMQRSVARAFLLGGLLIWAGQSANVLRWPFWIAAFFTLVPGVLGLAPLVMMSRGDSRLSTDAALPPGAEAMQEQMQGQLARAGLIAAGFQLLLAVAWALDVTLVPPTRS